MADVTIPTDLWDEDKQAVITAWLVDDGATVKHGDLLAEIMVEKTQHEVTASAAGVIRIVQKMDAVVNKGDVIATIG
ncbi:MAG: lipoyl domain-containing protein [Rhodanobacteraceae bacterium]